MIKVDNIDVWGFEHAIRGMRNPLNSHDKSDSGLGCKDGICTICGYFNACTRKEKYNTQSYHIGENDLSLMRKLYKAGTEHRKYLRQIIVSMDITAPLYWWKEMDQYRINVTTNSCSTMHKLHDKEFTLDDFSREHLMTLPTKLKGKDIECNYDYKEVLQLTINALNAARDMYLATKDKKYWWQMIQILPSSYNQKRTVTMNYENVMNVLAQRSNHKLDEWLDFCKILRQLPYVEEITGEYIDAKNK